VTYTTALNRDNNGRVSKVNYTKAGSTTPGSIGVDFFYLGATDPKIKNGKSFFLVSGVTINDSTAYEYSGTQVTRTNHYWSTATVAYTLIEYYVYTYDARGNLTSVKYYEVEAPGSPNFRLLKTYTYVYDDKVNPIYSKDDALIEFNGSQYISPNNVVSGSYTSVSTPADNYTFTTTYEYRSDGRPTKSTTTDGGVTLVSTYTYKQ
jgi:YD repeat-containing protein